MKASELRDEARIVASTVAGLLLGRDVWLPPERAPDTKWIDQADKRNLDSAKELYKDRLKSESEGVESVRRRAEFALTFVIAALGLSTSAFGRLLAVAPHSHWPLILWVAGVLVVACSISIFAGVAVSKKVLGTVDLQAFAHMKNGRREELRQYVLAANVTSRTRRVVVTVFRDGFLAALVGLILLATAFAWSWTIPVEDARVPVIINIIGTLTR